MIWASIGIGIPTLQVTKCAFASIAQALHSGAHAMQTWTRGMWSDRISSVQQVRQILDIGWKTKQKDDKVKMEPQPELYAGGEKWLIKIGK